MVLMKLGVRETKGELISKQVFQYSAINPKVEPGVNHDKSPHCMSLQRSKYICIDDSVDKKYVLWN